MGVNDTKDQLAVAIETNIETEALVEVLNGRLTRIGNAITSGQPDAVKLQVIGLILHEGDHK